MNPATLKISSLKQIAHKYTTFLFDLDGVIWIGPQRVKGGFQVLEYLREQNKRMFFITNSSIRNKSMLKERFKSFGFQAQIDEICPSDFITRLYLQQNYPNVKKILVFGQKNLADELKLTGLPVWHYDDPSLIEDVSKIIAMIDKDVDLVVMGYDMKINYTKLCLASFHIQKGAKLIATNPDKSTKYGGFRLPGCGSLMSTIELTTGIKAEVAGKPNPFFISYLSKEFNIKKQECLMIGDNLETDISFGRNSGIDTLCVLTGISNQKMVLDAQTPTYYCQYLL